MTRGMDGTITKTITMANGQYYLKPGGIPCLDIQGKSIGEDWHGKKCFKPI